MKISTRGEYGLRAMLELALHFGNHSPIRNIDISRRQGIPEQYLKQLIPILRKSGLVKSFRGPNGGHTLSQKPEAISIAEIIRALEGPLAPMDCVADSDHFDCTFTAQCAIREVYLAVTQATEQILESVTLADLCKKKTAKEYRENSVIRLTALRE